MDKKLILHIGAGKTGTSSIQNCIGINSAELSKRGIFVPSSDLSASQKVVGQHVWYFAGLRKLTINEAKSKLESDLKNIFKLNPGKTILLSAENLSDRNNISALFSDLTKEIKIQIVFYVRRQDDYLLSAWQQWFAKADSDLWAWIIRNAGVIANWKDVIDDWMRVVPKENIKVRVYDRKMLVGNDVVLDFLEVLKISTEGINLEKGINQNPSFNLGILDFVEKNSNLFQGAHDNEFYSFLAKYSPSSKKISRHSPITFKQRMAILSKYQNSNDWILKSFFDNGRNSLFNNPRESDFEVLSETEIQDLKWKAIIELTYNMYKDGKKR